MNVSLIHYLVLGAILFSIGVYGVLTRRHAIGVLMSIELIFNAVNINLVAFARNAGDIAGQAFALFIIAVAAAEASVGLALIIMIYRNFKSVNVDEIDLLKW